MIIVARKQRKTTGKLQTKSQRCKKPSADEVMDLLRQGKLNSEQFCEITNHLPPSDRKRLLDQLLRELRDLDDSQKVGSCPAPGTNPVGNRAIIGLSVSPLPFCR